MEGRGRSFPGFDSKLTIQRPQKGDTYLLAWVDHHDEAMDWARNKQFEVNPVTGALQVVDVEASIEAIQVVAAAVLAGLKILR